jgi:hypothetical protein
MAVYTVFSALGLKLQVRAILDPDRSGLGEYLEHHEEMFFYEEGGEKEDYVPSPLATHDVVGRLGGHGISEFECRDGSGYKGIVGAWGGDWRKVIWVNGPKKSDLDMVHMTVSLLLRMNTMDTDNDSMATRLVLERCTRVLRFLLRCHLRSWVK